MSHERVEGLIAKWREVSCSQDKFYVDGKCPTCQAYSDRATELAAALAAEGQGDARRKLSLSEVIIEHWFSGYTLCSCKHEKFDIPMEDLAAKYPRVNRYVFEAEQHRAYAEHIADIFEQLGAAAPSLHKEGLPAIEKLIRLIEASRDGFLDGKPYILTYSDIIEELKAMLPTERAALHKEGAGGECAYKKQHNIGFPCPHCGVIEPLPLQRTLPDEQFKGVVVEAIGAERAQSERIILNLDFATAGAIGLFEFLRSKGFEVASPAGRAEQK